MKLLQTLLILLLILYTIYALDLTFINSIKKYTWNKIFGEKIDQKLEPRLKRQSNSQFTVGTGDESELPTEARSSSLPMKNNKINLRYMPTLGNGHISATVYSPEMFLNGLYNGQGKDSHRAVIPSLLMTKGELLPEIERSAIRKFTFDAKTGIFTEKIECSFANIEHKIYMHARYVRLMVANYKITKKNIVGSSSTGKIKYKYPSANSSADMTMLSKKAVSGGALQYKYRTKVAESGGTEDIVIWMNDPLGELNTYSSQKVQEYTIIMSIDKQESAARLEYEAARTILDQSGQEQFLKEHVDVWNEIWNDGRIEVIGPPTIAKITHFSQYYLLSSLPPLKAKYPPPRSQVYVGAAREGGAKGGPNSPYKGHVMWDSEMYILPAVVLFHPTHAKYMLWYRGSVAEAAKQAAQADNFTDGYKFPWQSAMSGKDLSPSSCKDCKNKLFVNGAITHGIRTYFSATKDRDYLTNIDYKGCDVMIESARYLANKVTYDSIKCRYVLKGVSGPDENHKNVDNNALINVMTSLAIHYARYFACHCNRPENEVIPDEFIQKALYMYLPWDISKRIHYQYEGFENIGNEDRISQADTILLGYPLNWNMSLDIYRNDLEYYETKIDQSGASALSWSFFAIGFRWIGEITKASSFFLKSYMDYSIQPFKIWTESPDHTNDDTEGAVNFLPGMGGFLQSVIYGYAGVRIRPEMLEFHNPIPVPDSEALKFTGFSYLGAKMNMYITQNRVEIEMRSVGDYELKLKRNDTAGKEELMVPGKKYVIEKEEKEKGFFIFAAIGSSCEHPRDYVYMPYGYSPWINFSEKISASVFLFNFITSLILVQFLL